jgi:acyl-CoA thioesterase-2
MTSPSFDADGPLAESILRALDALLGAFGLEPLDDDRFRATNELGRFGRVFGGQTVAQALLAASATVDGKDPHSIHAYFVETGDLAEPLDLHVERVRDGRSVATRRVTVGQCGRTLLTAMVSFETNRAVPTFPRADPVTSSPEDLPLLQEWFRELPDGREAQAGNWIEQPPPFEMRIGEAPSFASGLPGDGPRTHWLRLPRLIGPDPLLHAATLAYGSDYLLLDMTLRAHPERGSSAFLSGFSVDHSLWLHAPVDLHEWHRYTQEAVAISGDRGLVRGAIHHADGHLVATVMQEVIVRASR